VRDPLAVGYHISPALYLSGTASTASTLGRTKEILLPPECISGTLSTTSPAEPGRGSVAGRGQRRNSRHRHPADSAGRGERSASFQPSVYAHLGPAMVAALLLPGASQAASGLQPPRWLPRPRLPSPPRWLPFPRPGRGRAALGLPRFRPVVSVAAGTFPSGENKRISSVLPWWASYLHSPGN
jgi:hypothetical protein